MQVEWVGQPVGLVVAHSRAVAERAAALVKVRVVARGVLCLPGQVVYEAGILVSFMATAMALAADTRAWELGLMCATKD